MTRQAETSTVVDTAPSVPLLPPACPMAAHAEWLLRAAAIVEDMDDAEADVAFAETMQPLWERFFHRTPETRSRGGAVAALRALVLSEDLSEEAERVVASVLRHLAGENV